MVHDDQQETLDFTEQLYESWHIMTGQNAEILE